jgi:hypothetical protein
MEWSKARKGRGKRQLRGAPGSESAGESLNHPLIDPNCPIHTLPLESRISQEISVEYASEEEDDEEEDEARESDSIRSMAEGTRQFGESAAGGSVAAGVSRTANHADGGVASRRPKKAITLRFDHFLGAAAKRLGVGRFSFARRGRWMDSVLSPPLPSPPPPSSSAFFCQGTVHTRRQQSLTPRISTPLSTTAPNSKIPNPTSTP